MNKDYRIDHLATQCVGFYGNEYNFREMSEVEGYVNAISHHSKGRLPVFSYWYGSFDNTPKGFIDSIKYLSEIYAKKTGIRLRGVIVDVYKKLKDGVNIYPHNIISIANRFAGYYIYQGYITGEIIYDMGEFYRCHYLINPVSFWDGGKFRQNKTDILEEEYFYLETVINEVLFKRGQVDYSDFAAHPVMS